MHQPCRVALLQKLSHEGLCCRMTFSVCVVLETCCSCCWLHWRCFCRCLCRDGKVFHCYRSGQNYLARFTVPHALKRPHCIILPAPCFTKGGWCSLGWSPSFCKHKQRLVLVSSHLTKGCAIFQYCIIFLQAALAISVWLEGVASEKGSFSSSVASQSIPVLASSDCLFWDYNSQLD